MMGIAWRVRSGTGVEHVATRAKNIMRKKAYHVTFSIRDACDVRRFHPSFPLKGLISISLERVLQLRWLTLLLLTASLMSNVYSILSVDPSL